METSRRNFLKTAAAAGVGAVLAGKTGKAQSSIPLQMIPSSPEVEHQLDEVTIKRFGADKVVKLDSPELTARLAKEFDTPLLNELSTIVEELKAAIPEAIPGARRMPQKTLYYLIKSPELNCGAEAMPMRDGSAAMAVVISTGMLDAVRNRAELKANMGHEMIHPIRIINGELMAGIHTDRYYAPHSKEFAEESAMLRVFPIPETLRGNAQEYLEKFPPEQMESAARNYIEQKLESHFNEASCDRMGLMLSGDLDAAVANLNNPKFGNGIPKNFKDVANDKWAHPSLPVREAELKLTWAEMQQRKAAIGSPTPSASR